jgi:hypothetical protein
LKGLPRALIIIALGLRLAVYHFFLHGTHVLYIWETKRRSSASTSKKLSIASVPPEVAMSIGRLPISIRDMQFVTYAVGQ